MDIHSLTHALIGLTPLPSVEVKGIRYFHQPDGSWTWLAGSRTRQRSTPAGSTLARSLVAAFALVGRTF